MVASGWDVRGHLLRTLPRRIRLLPDWHLESLGTAALPGDGSGVVVAVIDSGVDATHPGFGDRVLPGASMIEVGGLGTEPTRSHGTGVAGLIAGSGGEVPAIGAAPGATILPVTIDDGQGFRVSALMGPYLGGRSGRRHHQHLRRRDVR